MQRSQQLAVMFLLGAVTVPSHVLEASGKRATWVGWSGTQMNFQQAVAGRRSSDDVEISAAR